MCRQQGRSHDLYFSNKQEKSARIYPLDAAASKTGAASFILIQINMSGSARSNRNANVFLNRALGRGYITRLTRGVYVNSRMKAEPSLEEAACFVRILLYQRRVGPSSARGDHSGSNRLYGGYAEHRCRCNPKSCLARSDNRIFAYQ